jgi:CopA family copper-resistance protein
MKRTELLRLVGSVGAAVAIQELAPSYAWGATGPVERATSGERVFDFTIGESPFGVNGRKGIASTVNGTVPGPLLRAREGENVVVRLNNTLKTSTSIHWHGVIVPNDMDGVPGVTFRGIEPGAAFEYRFPVRQSGTYWYHSHSGLEEQRGVYGPIILDPADPEPIAYDRDYVVLLSDWSFESPMKMIANLKKYPGYYNFQKPTVADYRAGGPVSTDWLKMRMDPTDFADVSGFTYAYLVNGMAPQANWTPLFAPGERVRLRFIGGAAMTEFDVRIPGLKLTVVQADGENVQPVEVDEFRIAPGETYDVVVQPTDNRAYTIFAEAMDRSGYARGTLAPRPGMSAPLPARRQRPLLSMADMGMDMSAMEMSGMSGMGGEPAKPSPDRSPTPSAASHDTGGMQMPGMNMPAPRTRSATDAYPPGSPPFPHGPDTHGVENSMTPMMETNRLDDPGPGLRDTGTRALVYSDLLSLQPRADRRSPTSVVELHLTGNMERYMWSFDGKKYSEAKAPIRLKQGERARIIFVNDTMMEHPMHLHGMFMQLENGVADHEPLKHTIRVKPAERLSVTVNPTVPGYWALHCHLLFHMELGMIRVVEVLPA